MSTPTRARGSRRWTWPVLRTLVVLLAAVVTVFPLYWMAVVALTRRTELLSGRMGLLPAHLTGENFARVFGAFPMEADGRYWVVAQGVESNRYPWAGR